MAIVRVQHIGMAVRDMHAACKRLEDLFGLKCRDFRAWVRGIQSHGILVVGSFIIGLDVFQRGSG
mgnify:CR=1 FL=1